MEKIIDVLDKRGWVGKDLVGDKANQAIFLVLQHSNLNIQQKYLPMLRKAVKDGNAVSSYLALMEDRVALREGRMQIYGSQVGNNPDTNKWYVLPLIDPENVDKRRSEVGLQPLANYVMQWGINWDIQDYLKQLPELKELNNIK